MRFRFLLQDKRFRPSRTKSVVFKRYDLTYFFATRRCTCVVTCKYDIR